MATHHGNEGIVKLTANTVAEVQSWTIEQGIDTVRDTAMGDTAHTHKTGHTFWSGSVTCNWDETDTNGQVALTIGASVTLNVYPEGDGAGDAYFTGTATVTAITKQASLDGLITASFTFEGNGALTLTTV